MTIEYLIGLFLLASSLCWTPGPNNTLLATSGARFGYVRTLPHILGVNFGFALMQFLLWMGLGGVFQAFPIIREVLRYVGAAVLIWIAWKIASAPMPSDDVKGEAKPWTFLHGAAFQWINPKGLIMVISLAGSLPETDPFWLSPLIAALVFLLAGTFSANGWALFGKGLQRFLHTPLRFHAFNIAMAFLLILTVIGLLFADLSTPH